MKFAKFAKFVETVSRIGFGAMGLGGAFGKHNEKALIHSVLHSLDRGVTFIDTARAYGNSDQLIGNL